MIENKNSLREEYKDLLPIDNQDYIDAKKYYEKYLEIFDGIIKCKDDEELKGLREAIESNNPWKVALKKSNKFRSIADSDRSILEPLIEKEIKNFKNEILSTKLNELYDGNNIVELLSNNSDEKEKLESIIDKEMGTKFYEAIFNDFEHVFDGNFENPRVVILGINPKLENIKHESYNLIGTYEKPFDNKRSTLRNKKAKKDYYFKPKGFFFSGMDNSDEANKLKNEFINSVTDINRVTPFALWEFFPYATCGEKEWFGGISISEKKIKEYIQLNKFLPSQIWLLCLLTFTIKKALFEPDRELYIFCTKRKQTFIDSFLKNYFEVILKITSTSNVKILLKKDDRNRSFNVNNFNQYFEDSGIVFVKNDFREFFKVIWDI